MKVHALSDIHIDFTENARAIEQISEYDYRDDILILAGDIAGQAPLMEQGLDVFTRRFKQVMFVPGNHDLWIDQNDYPDSMDKYRSIRTLAKSYDISMSNYHNGSLTIVPLLGWYDYSFGAPDKTTRQMWMDFKECIWPEGFDAAKITRSFLSRNNLEIPEDHTVISFSHFLPRIDVMPHYIPKHFRFLYPVLGSNLLDKQVRQIRSQIHVYGHSHVNRDVTIKGIRYVNNAFGYPDETRITTKKMKCIYDTEWFGTGDARIPDRING